MEPGIFMGELGFYGAAAFLAGIIAAGLGWGLMPLVFSMVFWGFVLLAIKQRLRLVSIRLLLGAVAALICGALYYHLYLDWQARLPELPFGQSTSFTGIVVDEPNPVAKFNILAVEPIAPRAREVDIFASPGSEYRYGDELKIFGAAEAPQFAGDSPAVFPKKITFVAAHKGFWLREKLIDFKAAVLEKFNEVLTSDQAALLAGETVGGSAGMGAELKNEMSVSGTSYILSMYGYKIAMIVLVLEELSRQWIARRARFFLLVGVIIFFVLMAGGNVSAVRGGLAALLALIAAQIGRIYNPRNALVLSAALMALWDPAAVTQAAFALSFLSIAGMVYLSAPLKKLFGWNDGTQNQNHGAIDWREAVVVAIASLLPIIPIIANAFGDFSLSSFPSNILISFGVLPAMVFGFALAATSFVSGYAAFFVAKFAVVFLLYQLAVIHLFNWIVVPLPVSFASPAVFTLYYIALALFVWRFSPRRRTRTHNRATPPNRDEGSFGKNDEHDPDEKTKFNP